MPDIIAIPFSGETLGVLDAILNNSGTMTENPTPINAKPKMVVTKLAYITKSNPKIATTNP